MLAVIARKDRLMGLPTHLHAVFAMAIALVAWASATFPVRAEPPPASALWSVDRRAAAASMRTATGPGVFVFLRGGDGSFQKIDVSAVERKNLGKLGLAQRYERIETRAVGWLPSQGELLRLEVRTQAWHQGRRYVAEELLMLRTDGRVLWR
ncbi:hypothetical protein [Lysobacter capsici]|uniref:hypothetical protein n=1 Tax=Lysobacter capsici TaxID=435897 RepID=UPI00287B6C5B|nr:hypothetical protein [Lysobacter capsici]WND79845.1 hypothetical protein RJ610_21575 [Lysobacter capsici]WND85041.1 hypothetical protein RJ609_21590 [Lysobacter capsici]